MKKQTLLIVSALLCFAASTPSYAENNQRVAESTSIIQQWLAPLGISLTERTPQPCHSKVDCREKGNNLTSTIQVRGRNFAEASQYPAEDRHWDHETQGYVLKTYGNTD